MPEYRALRQQYGMLELCRTPDLAAQVTLQPVDAMEVDAAILFSDLLLPLEPMGLSFDFVKGEGPAFDDPIRSAADVDRVRAIDPGAALGYVLDTIRQVKPRLDVPLIGFVGAPFTLASYAIEGGPSKDFARTKAMMYAEPDAWHTLCARLADMAGAYLRAQVEAGVDAVQVFDSWVGQLGACRLPGVRPPPHASRLPGHCGPRRALHPLRRRDGHAARGHGHGRQFRGRGRLAHAPGSGLAAHRSRPRHSGQPGPDPAAGPLAPRARRRRGHRVAGGGQTGTHLQPRPWRTADDLARGGAARRPAGPYADSRPRCDDRRHPSPRARARRGHRRARGGLGMPATGRARQRPRGAAASWRGDPHRNGRGVRPRHRAGLVSHQQARRHRAVSGTRDRGATDRHEAAPRRVRPPERHVACAARGRRIRHRHTTRPLPPFHPAHATAARRGCCWSR